MDHLTMTLREYCEKFTQAEAGIILKRSQGAVAQMLKENRQVYITRNSSGKWSGYEIKPFHQYKAESKKAVGT